MAKIGSVKDFDPQSQAVGPSASLPMNSKQSPANPIANSQRTPQAYLTGGGTARPSKSVSGPIKTGKG